MSLPRYFVCLIDQRITIIRLNYNANAGYGITELEDALGGSGRGKALVDVKRFGALAQDVLKQTIDEMKKLKHENKKCLCSKALVHSVKFGY
jgi:hypothetical protein